MADVQLKHGYLRLANSLDEAITIAPFSGTQMKIVRCLVRLTYGWNENAVRMSRPDIAERCGLAPVGGFLRAFDELLEANVVQVLEEPFGRLPGVYALNKDFEHWGPYSVAAARLEALFSKRPQSGRRPTLQGQSSMEGQQTLEGMSSDRRQTLQGMGDPPYRVTHPDPIGSVTGVPTGDTKAVTRLERQERHRKTIKRKDRGASAPHSLTLAELLRSIPRDAVEFHRDFYGESASDRQLDIARQLHALAIGKSVPNEAGQRVQAHGVERLAAKCLEVIGGPSLRDPDLAIVVLLRKLGDTTDVSADRVETEHREIEQEERLGAVAARVAAEWAAANPELAAQLRAEIERDIPGDSSLITQTRQWAFVSRVRSLAEPVGTERRRVPDDSGGK